MNIGQLRRNQITSYTTPIGYKQSLFLNENSIINFYDPSLYFSGGNTLSSLYSYYLKFEVKQTTVSVQDFEIKLQNEDVLNLESQEIREFSVKMGNGSTVFELIFTPNSNYNYIIFELKRLALDFYIDNGDGTSGRIMDIKILQFERVNNVVSDYLSTQYQGLKVIKKLGIQGPPSLLMVIDGEEIRVGKSGIYELYDDELEISYIGFIIKESNFTQDGEDFFIMDFKY